MENQGVSTGEAEDKGGRTQT